MSGRHGRGTAATAGLLRELLASDPKYRRIWRSRVSRTRSDLSRSAVAKVLEQHLWDTGERSEEDTSLARELKDRVSRALNGSAISTQTLTWIIDAFGMTESDADRLWQTFSNPQAGFPGISNTLARRREMIRRQCHRTVALAERYAFDADGYLASRHTYHTIRAIEDGIDIYIFNHEPEASNVEVVHGGTVGRSYLYGGGLTSVELIFERPLAKPESTMLEYQTQFVPGASPVTEVRRAAFARSENVDIAVAFNEARTPKAAWWCVWDDQIGGRLVSRRNACIQRGAVHHYVPYIENTVVGFQWEW